MSRLIQQSFFSKLHIIGTILALQDADFKVLCDCSSRFCFMRLRKRRKANGAEKDPVYDDIFLDHSPSNLDDRDFHTESNFSYGVCGNQQLNMDQSGDDKENSEIYEEML